MYICFSEHQWAPAKLRKYMAGPWTSTPLYQGTFLIINKITLPLTKFYVRNIPKYKPSNILYIAACTSKNTGSIRLILSGSPVAKVTVNQNGAHKQLSVEDSGLNAWKYQYATLKANEKAARLR